MKKRILKKIFYKNFKCIKYQTLKKIVIRDFKKEKYFLKNISKKQNQYLKLDKNKFIKFSIFFDETRIYFK